MPYNKSPANDNYPVHVLKAFVNYCKHPKYMKVYAADAGVSRWTFHRYLVRMGILRGKNYQYDLFD